MRAKLAGAILLSAVGVLALWLSGAFEPSSGAKPDSPAGTTGALASEEPAKPSAGTRTDDRVAPGAGSTDAREAIRELGRVLDVADRPVAQAYIVAAQPVDADLVAHLGGPEPSALRARSSVEGTFRLDGSDADGAVLAALAVGHVAQAQPVRGSSPTFRLDPAAPIAFRVEDPSGTPIAGATVRYVATFDQHFVQRSETSASDGSVLLPAVPSTLLVQAAKGELLSGVWRGRAPFEGGRQTLVLSGTCSAGGRVIAPRTADLSGARVTVRTEKLPADILATTAVTDRATWEIAAIPRTSGPLIFRLEGAGGTVEARRPVPESGEKIEVDFEAVAGHTVLCEAVDSNRAVQSGVELAAIWDRDGEWIRASAVTGADGIARIESVPETSAWIRSYSDEFADEAFGPFKIPGMQPDQPFEIRLNRSVLVRGRCTFDGKPLADFAVTHGVDWTGVKERTEFTGKEDGEFELEVPEGEVWFFASAADYTQGPSVQLDVRAGDDSPVELVVTRPVAASGRVIDAVTFEPVSSASIQVHTVHGMSQSDAWGAPVATRSDGRFESLPLAPGPNAIATSAPGYAVEVSRIEGNSPATSTGLVFALYKKQSLTIVLKDPSTTNFSKFRLGNAGRLSYRDADANGHAVFEDVGFGEMRLRILHPSGTVTDILAVCPPGVDTVKEVHVGTERTVRARLVPPSGEALPEKMWIGANFRAADGSTPKSLASVGADGSAVFSAIEGGKVVFEVYRLDGKRYGSYWREIPDEAVVELELPLEDQPRTLRVVDAADEPVASAYVELGKPGDSTGFVQYWRVDSAGQTSIAATEADSLEVRVYEPGLFWARTQTIDLETAQDPIVVRVDPTSSLRARVLERESARSGVLINVHESDSGPFITEVTSVAGGLITLDRVSPGGYTLAVASPGYWPSKHAIQARVDAPEVPIQVRRIASARIEVTRAGVAVPQATVSLRSVELDTDVSEWVQEGRARTGESGWTTDQQGHVTVQKIPDGAYAWTVRFPDGETMTGQQTLQPAAVTTIRVARP
ncbi:MAG: carboxypeptidase regulatory-like domain-containing protein [bacterium]|nr:carboxypeptidase regulatory-like domain-containing protein [bacterium]